MSITINDENREQFGGDIAITSTVPKIHPKLNIPLSGTRKSIQGASSYYRTFFRGDIIFRDNPSLEFNFTLWPDDGSELSRNLFLLYTIEKGFKVCSAEDWDLAPELQRVYSVENGQLVIHGSKVPYPSKEVLMFRTRERWEQEQRSLQQTENILPESDRQIAASIGDKRVQPLPTTIEVTPHRYNTGDVVTK